MQQSPGRRLGRPQRVLAQGLRQRDARRDVGVIDGPAQERVGTPLDGQDRSLPGRRPAHAAVPNALGQRHVLAAPGS